MAAKNKPSGQTTPPGAMNVVKNFLTHAIDRPDKKKAETYLTAECLAQGSFNLPPEMVGAQYTIQEPIIEAGQLWIPVQINASSQTLVVPLAPVEENGKWKLDMNKTAEKMLGGMMEGVVNHLTDAVGKVMEGVGEAMASAFHDATSAPSAENDTPPLIDSALLNQFKINTLESIKEGVLAKLDFDIPLDIDFSSLLTADHEDANRQRLDLLKSRVFSNWDYWLREINEKLPLRDRVKAIRI